MKQFIIDEEIVRGLLTYLAGRPYQEVFQGIEALQKLKQLEILEAKTSDKHEE